MGFTLVASAQDLSVAPESNETESQEFSLYPNPVFDDVVYIVTPTGGSKEITIYDVFGKVVLRDRISTRALNISKLVPGVYVLKVNNNKATMTRKLVVK